MDGDKSTKEESFSLGKKKSLNSLVAVLDSWGVKFSVTKSILIKVFVQVEVEISGEVKKVCMIWRELVSGHEVIFSWK